MRYALAFVPLALGIALTTVGVVAGDPREVVVGYSFAWLWFGLGLLASGIALALVVSRAGRRRAVLAARAEGEAAQRENQARFLSRLDHELKNPLTAIRAGLSNLDAGDPTVESIDGQVLRLSRLITDLRKLAELRSVTLDLAPVDLSELATEVVDALGDTPEHAARAVTLGFPRAPRPLPAVRGDYDLLFLALYNLVSNSMKYSAASDTIEVRGSEGDGTVTLEIADTGRGIPSDEIARVWEELSRGRGALDVAGSGLGLPFVKAVIERHGGTVNLESREREGTLVRVTLPV